MHVAIHFLFLFSSEGRKIVLPAWHVFWHIIILWALFASTSLMLAGAHCIGGCKSRCKSQQELRHNIAARQEPKFLKVMVPIVPLVTAVSVGAEEG